MLYNAITELEAVNSLLRFIGEQPVNALDSQVFSALVAQNCIQEISREVQSFGWWFNSEDNYELAVDSEGFINIPPNALKSDPSTVTNNYVQRGLKLYNKIDHTFTFSENVLVDIVFFLPFSDLPQTARTYIMKKALKQFQMAVLGSELLYQVSAAEVEEAYISLRAEDIENEDSNVFNDSFHVYDFMKRTV